MNNRLFKQSLLTLLLVLLASSCSDRFGDDLRSLGSRVEVLESSVLKANTELEALSTIIKTILSNGYIKEIKDKANGSYEVTMIYYTFKKDKDGNEVATPVEKTYTLQNGNPGESADLNITVKQENGIWYWYVYNKEDSNVTKIRAGGVDGKDGKADEILPQLRINHETGMWEILTDGVWKSLGIRADGKDGGPAIIQNIHQEGNIVYIELYGGQIIPVKAAPTQE